MLLVFFHGRFTVRPITAHYVENTAFCCRIRYRTAHKWTLLFLQHALSCFVRIFFTHAD